MDLSTFCSCFLETLNNSRLQCKLSDICTFLIILSLVILYRVKFHADLNPWNKGYKETHNAQLDWSVRSETPQAKSANGKATFAAKESYNCLKIHKHVFNKLNLNGYDEVLTGRDAIKYILKLPK